jgi:lipid-A-disaccharide synthase
VNAKHIVIMAGEASGDQHAAHLVQELKTTHPAVKFSGIGGQKMQEAGVKLIQDISRLNIMGFTEVILHFKTIRCIFKQMEAHLKKTQPDLLILVDYPGFNLRLAKSAKAMGVKVLYYISPQLWAWKPGRIKTIQENVDHMAVILPFEKKLYEDANVPVNFVGHPLIHTVKTQLSNMEIREKYQLSPTKKIIALIPGSRRAEIKRLFPIMLKAAELLKKNYPNLVFILPIAPTLSQENFNPYYPENNLPIHFISPQSKTDQYDLINACHSVMITSGTATLETALLTKPMVIVYKTSVINYMIASKVIRIKYIGLCNLLANKMVVPEMLQHDLTPNNLFQAMKRFLDDPIYYQTTKTQLQEIKDSLTEKRIDKSLANVVLECLDLKYRKSHQ